MYEDFINAIKNFKQNKIRTILSLLGVIIGVASVIIITTIGESATANIKASFGNSGLDLISVSLGGMRWRATSSNLTLNDSFRTELFDSVSHIKRIFYKNNFSATLRNGSVDVSASLTAIEDGYLEMNRFDLDSGIFFPSYAYETGIQKIILGSETAASLFPEGNAVGQSIVVDYSGDRFGFEVIGVLKEQTAGGMESPNRAAYVTRKFYGKKIVPNAAASMMIVQVTNQSYSVSASEEIKQYISQKAGSSDAAQITSMTGILDQFNQVTETLSMLLSGVAAISLLVGGIGIMNIMIVSVTERKKEIGIRKALGATPSVIKRQFLVESASITLFGGIIGILTGLIISFIADYILSWVFAVKWGAILLSFLFSAFVGIFFGLSPAVRASKLDPVEALSAE